MDCQLCHYPKKQLANLDVVPRHMLRSIVGWRRVDNEAWASTMKRMNARISDAMCQYPIASWTQQLRNRKFTSASTFASWSGWHTHAIKWVPATNWGHNFTQMPHRKQGRPATRWDDDLRSFAANYFRIDDWLDCAAFSHQWRELQHIMWFNGKCSA